MKPGQLEQDGQAHYQRVDSLDATQAWTSIAWMALISWFGMATGRQSKAVVKLAAECMCVL